MLSNPSVGQTMPGSRIPIRGSYNPPITGLLLTNASRLGVLISATELFRI